jgi:hypothetical protein
VVKGNLIAKDEEEVVGRKKERERETSGKPPAYKPCWNLDPSECTLKAVAEFTVPRYNSRNSPFTTRSWTWLEKPGTVQG